MTEVFTPSIELLQQFKFERVLNDGKSFHHYHACIALNLLLPGEDAVQRRITLLGTLPTGTSDVKDAPAILTLQKSHFHDNGALILENLDRLDVILSNDIVGLSCPGI